ncbi:MAG: hypothetical protein MZU95_15210 [Desulfomicrobium escambiense]|nr:hypothetical protein [Desulfomicrobium escambiense]
MSTPKVTGFVGRQDSHRHHPATHEVDDPDGPARGAVGKPKPKVRVRA